MARCRTAKGLSDRGLEGDLDKGLPLAFVLALDEDRGVSSLFLEAARLLAVRLRVGLCDGLLFRMGDGEGGEGLARVWPFGRVGLRAKSFCSFPSIPLSVVARALEDRDRPRLGRPSAVGLRLGLG